MTGRDATGRKHVLGKHNILIYVIGKVPGPWAWPCGCARDHTRDFMRASEGPPEMARLPRPDAPRLEEVSFAVYTVTHCANIVIYVA